MGKGCRKGRVRGGRSWELLDQVCWVALMEKGCRKRKVRGGKSWELRPGKLGGTDEERVQKGISKGWGNLGTETG